jgi:hypothetical protein
MYSAAGTTEALQSNACRREKVSHRLTGLYVCVVLPLAEESYVGNEASADASCYFRENSRCPRTGMSLKVVSFFVRGVVEVSSPIHQSAHRAAHHAMELERHGVPPRFGAAALTWEPPGVRIGRIRGEKSGTRERAVMVMVVLKNYFILENEEINIFRTFINDGVG